MHKRCNMCASTAGRTEESDEAHYCCTLRGLTDPLGSCVEVLAEMVFRARARRCRLLWQHVFRASFGVPMCRASMTDAPGISLAWHANLICGTEHFLDPLHCVHNALATLSPVPDFVALKQCCMRASCQHRDAPHCSIRVLRELAMLHCKLPCRLRGCQPHLA